MSRPIRRLASLRRQRLLRLVVGVTGGALVTIGVLAILSQLGVTSHERWPWWSGLTVGLLMSIAIGLVRLGARRYRIRMVKTAFVALATVAVPLALIVMAEPVAAQGRERCGVTIIEVDGRATDLDLEALRRNRPLVLDRRPQSMTIRVELPAGAAPADQRWRAFTRVAGADVELHSERAGEQSQHYRVRFVDRTIPPGVYPVWGQVDGVCASGRGYVRVEGAPWDNAVGILAGLAVVLGSIGLIAAFGPNPTSSWVVAAAPDLELAVLDPDTGRVARGALTAGRTYLLETRIIFPDPPSAYLGLAEPVHVLVGILGASTSPVLRSIDPSAGEDRTSSAFSMPTAGDGPAELIVDVELAGNLLRTVRLVETVSNAAGIESPVVDRAAGQITYQAGSFAASDLLGLHRVDAMVVVHGDARGERVDVWSLRGEASLRVAGRERLPRSELDLLATSLRTNLAQVISAEWVGQDPAAGLASLADAGARARRALLGHAGSAAGPGDRVAIHHDTESLGAITFPWGALYEGETTVDVDHPSVCRQWDHTGFSCGDHRAGELCPSLLWGLRHEITAPGGWLPDSYGSGGWFGLRGTLRPAERPTDALAWRLANQRPIRVLVGGGGADLDLVAHAEELASIRGTAITVAGSPIEFTSAFEARPSGAHNQYDLIYFYTHHGQGQPVAFDDGPLDDRGFRRLIASADLRNGPLVIVNACSTGVLPSGATSPLLDALRSAGARGIVVTESAIQADAARAAGLGIVDRFLAGQDLNEAVLATRRAHHRRLGSSALIAYSAYGPPRLRLARPAAHGADGDGSGDSARSNRAHTGGVS